MKNSISRDTLETLPTETLEWLIRMDFATEDQETELDPDTILAITDILCLRDPQPVDVDAAWAEFSARLEAGDREETDSTILPFPQGKGERKPRGFRAKRPWIFTAAALALVLVIVGAANGPKAMESKAHDGIGTFRFPSDREESEEFLAIRSQTMVDSLLTDIQSVTSYPVLPGWYPEGSYLEEYSNQTSGEDVFMSAEFSRGEGAFAFQLSRYGDVEGVNSSYSKDGPVEEYTVGHITHYLMSNQEINLAVWRNGNVECSILGDLSIDELKKMVDSIYAE